MANLGMMHQQRQQTRRPTNYKFTNYIDESEDEEIKEPNNQD
jgi:hypothetical protein